MKDCEGEHKLWTREGNTFTAHPVKIGISNGVNTEIISGINEGTVVVTEATIGSMPGSGAPDMSRKLPEVRRVRSCLALREVRRRAENNTKKRIMNKAVIELQNIKRQLPGGGTKPCMPAPASRSPS